jgi:hypothetical protein
MRGQIVMNDEILRQWFTVFKDGRAKENVHNEKRNGQLGNMGFRNAHGWEETKRMASALTL